MSSAKRVRSPAPSIALEPTPDEARTLVFDAANFGEGAAMFRESPVVREALQRLRQRVFRQFKQAPATDVAALQRARIAWDLLDEFDAALGQIVTDGKAAHGRQLRSAS